MRTVLNILPNCLTEIQVVPFVQVTDVSLESTNTLLIRRIIRSKSIRSNRFLKHMVFRSLNLKAGGNDEPLLQDLILTLTPKPDLNTKVLEDAIVAAKVKLLLDNLTDSSESALRTANSDAENVLRTADSQEAVTQRGI